MKIDSLHQVLLVEDSIMFGRLAKKRIEEEFNASVFWAKNYAEAEKLLAAPESSFAVALLDFNLPDAPEGEIIDRVVSEGISVFVFTSDLTEEVREQVWAKRVADYIVKEDPNSLEYVVKAIRQLLENEETPVLVVDATKGYRNMISELLYVRRLRVLTAADGITALQVLEQYPEIRLVFVDSQLPDMDGCSLCQKIRKKTKLEDMAIIGLPPSNERGLGAKFVKSGASDFLLKDDFLVEEFYIRTNRCLELINLVKEIKAHAVKDTLTRLFNRRYFYDEGEKLLKICISEQDSMACIMLGIDGFREINDRHGHDVGDRMIEKLGELLEGWVAEKEIAARFGGAEFCLLLPGIDRQQLHDRIEQLRESVAANPLTELDAGPVKATMSAGCCLSLETNLDEMIRIAGANYSEAMSLGGNCVLL